MKHYFSVQYSAIQKTVLRHNRLWSIAGISQGLSRLNEIEMEQHAIMHGGTAMVAGGGKFTAWFDDPDKAGQAKKEIIRALATRFPMLEFQASDIVKAQKFKGDRKQDGQEQEQNSETDDSAKGQGILDRLNEQKRQFRGYGTSYLPHLAVCGECGEYPAEKSLKKRKKQLCRTCFEAYEAAYKPMPEEVNKQTSLEKIYARYFDKVKKAKKLRLLYDFQDLFPDAKDSNETGGRMAVWFSDLNNMNQKVPIWLDQPENEILGTFNKVKEASIDVVSQALATTFSNEKIGKRKNLPFRLVVAGGDDLCLVMAEEDILTFAEQMDQAVRNKIKQLDIVSTNPLNMQWLKNHAQPNRDGTEREIGPYSFGASFVITSIHTPFKRIHELGEELMKQAKEETERLGNSVNWRIMAENRAVSDTLLEFERPLYISEKAIDKDYPKGFDRLFLVDYLNLLKTYKKISSSHRFAIIGKLIELRQENRQDDFENWLKCYDGGERDKSFSGLLREPLLRKGNKLSGHLVPERIATLFELLGIKDGASKKKQRTEENV